MIEAAGRCTAILTLLAAFSTGCGPGADVQAQRTRLEFEQRARMDSLQRIEARLLDAQARSREWEELKSRHARVSAIACENMAEHVAGMEKNEAWQVEKRRRLHESRVAQASVPDGQALRRASIPTAGN